MPHIQGLVDSIEKMCDTNITSIADQDYLIYDVATGKWINLPSLSLNIKTITEDYTVLSNDRVILCDTSTGNIVVTLPAAATNGESNIYIKKIDTSEDNTVTIEPADEELLDGETNTIIYVPYTSLHIVCNGTSWFII